MRKVELLSPVGNMNTLPFAVHNGADAVYLSGKKFGARKFANNFTDEELKMAVQYCHLYGVKVYVTVNTLIFDDEMEEVLSYISFLQDIDVDALIMQDIGLIKRTHQQFPELEIHISTQCHNHNEAGLKFFEALGARRAVLDRELSLDEIKKIKTSLQKEVFIHGALCISYSGCCLFSSMNGGRSGNRGECVASCRQPYELYKNNQLIKTKGKYLLSTRELNTLPRLKDLLDAAIDSFKIEGRMKSPEYVGFVTKLYRKAIDRYYQNKDINVTEEDLNNLKKLYNRDFTLGYLFNKSGNQLMNIITSNHQGVVIGQVIDYNKKYIKIKLDDSLFQEDAIRLPNEEGMVINRLYNSKLLLVNSLSKGDIAYVDNKVNLNKKGLVKKTIDKNLIEQLQKIEEKKIAIDITLICKIGQPLKMSFFDGHNSITKEGKIVELAHNCQTDSERLKQQIIKLGNTPFIARQVTIDKDDNVFIPIADLNSLRRLLVDELINIRQKWHQNRLIKSYPPKKLISKRNAICINVLVHSEEQLQACLSNNVDLIYTDNVFLYQKYKNSISIYLRLPRVILKHKEYSDEKLLVSEIGSIQKYTNNNQVLADYTINATNHDTIETLENMGVFMVTLSPEVTLNHISKTDFNNVNVEYFAYGTVELMIMKYCPIKMLENNDQDNCNLCQLNNDYYLKDQYGNHFPIRNTKHYTHIYHKEATDNIKNIKICLKRGINNFRVELLDETKEEINMIIMKIRKEMED